MEAVARTGAVAAATARTGALVLVGFMGAGKSSGARAIAAELRVEPTDTDHELERELGEPLEAFFDRAGEAEFRRREEAVVLRVLERTATGVVALGGGALGSPAVRDALRRHTVVYLEIDAEDAWRRASGKGRPLARDRGRFDDLHRDRRHAYESVADAILSPGGRELAHHALPALIALRDAPAEPGAVRLVWASAGSGGYPVFLGEGLLERGFMYPAGPNRYVVTDQNVAHHHRIDAEGEVAVAPGERSKSLAGAEAVLRALARAGLARDDLLVALGGGVVGDLAGFCGAIYQRGVRVVQVPTTLVAQVDAAYGGKTGVDLPEGKNYVGAYHPPVSVLADPLALRTLPPEELRAGYVEVVKTALIAGGELWTKVRRGEDPDPDVILGCVRTKLAIVAEDERDEGRRQVLNLGHTIGHAIEAATGYERYRHGEAVAVGLLCALRLSGRDALRDEVAALLGARGLPTRFSGTSPEDVLALTERDKKRRGGRVPFVLVDAPGAVSHGHDVPEAQLRAVLAEAHTG